jgi:uncharacterized protein YndB with AHSA1/START domain
MSVMTRSIIIPAPAARCSSSATRVKVLTPDGVGSSTHAYVHALGIHFEGTVKYTEVVANERIVAKVSFPGEHPTWTFAFEPLDGGTRLTMRAEWHVKAPVVGRIMDEIKAREHGSMAEQWLEAVKNRVEPEAVP